MIVNHPAFILRALLLLLGLCCTVSMKLAAQTYCVNQAREFYRNGEYMKTIEILNGCTDESPGIEHHTLLASSYFHSGDLTNSFRLVQSITDSVSSAEVISLKARIAFMRSDYESAFRYYNLIFTSDSNNVTAIRQLAVCSDKLDSTQSAISYYHKALALNPSDMVSGIRLVEKYAFADDFDAADSLSNQLLQIDSLPDLLRLRGDLLYRMKAYQEAYACYEPLLRTGTSNADLLRKAGICKFAIGETELSITMLSTAHLIDPSDEIACYYLAMAYQSMADYKSSELFFKAAITNGISLNMGNYYHRMADMYETAGNYEKALDAFKKALEYREANHEVKPEIHSEIGRIYEVYFEDYKNAMKYYDYFLKSYPDTTNYKYMGVKNRKENLQKKLK